ncbi:hypothetical protein ACHAP5_009288 [Fusarium lateritium]
MSVQPYEPPMPTPPQGVLNPAEVNPLDSTYVIFVFDGGHFRFARRSVVAKAFGIATDLQEVLVRNIIPVPGLDIREACSFIHYLKTGQFGLIKSEAVTAEEQRKCILIECLSLYGAAMRYDLQELAKDAVGCFSHYGDQIGVKAVLVMLSDYHWAGRGGEACIAEYTLRRHNNSVNGFFTLPDIFLAREKFGMENTIAEVLLQLDLF